MIRILVKPGEKLTILEGYGALTNEEIEASLRSYYRGRSILGNWLCDLRDADTSQVSQTKILQAIAEHDAIADRRRAPSTRRRIAFVGAAPPQLELGQAVATLVETTRNGVSVKVFQSMADALAWVMES